MGLGGRVGSEREASHREESGFYSKGDGEPLGFLERNHMPEKDRAINRERREGGRQARGSRP